MKTQIRRGGMAALALALGAAAQAQPVCSSDGRPPPTALLERFINADCAGCWTQLQVPQPAPGEAVLDWIVPGERGEDAPLAAAARPEALERLAALGRAVPRNDDSRRTRRAGPPVSVRVAHGLAFNGYIGASIEFRDPGPGPWRAWVALVEELPPGTERTPVARTLVRNVLHLSWDTRGARGRKRSEARPMNIPAGADPERLQVLGVVQDARGRIRGIARSRCTLPDRKG